MASEGLVLEKKPESRSGMRRVSSLSAEQLERKRANDREAQRLIRQRTKEQIEGLQKQISMLQNQIQNVEPSCDRLAKVMQQNAALRDENNRLKHQLASLNRHPGLSHAGERVVPATHHTGRHRDEALGSAAPRIPSTWPLLPSHYTGMPHALHSRAASALSASSRSSYAHEWEHLSATRSPSLRESSGARFSNPIGQYGLESPLHQSSHIAPTSIPDPNRGISFSDTACPSQQASESSFSYLYPASQIRRGEELHHPPGQQQPIGQLQSQYLHPHWSTSLPNVSQASQHPSSWTYWLSMDYAYFVIEIREPSQDMARSFHICILQARGGARGIRETSKPGNTTSYST